MQLRAGEIFPAAEDTGAIFGRVYRELSRETLPPAVELTVKPYVNTMGKLHLREGVLEVRLSDLMAGAPATVREALAWMLVSKLFRKKPPAHWVRHFRQYLNRSETRRVHQAVRATRGRKYVSGPKGEFHDLEEIYHALRDSYFDPLMQMPQLGWSRRSSRSLLGHFDHTHNAIILSRILDRADVPRYVVEYVLYHEMLHLKHPVEHRASRRTIHSPAFRSDERKFARLADAKEFLKHL